MYEADKDYEGTVGESYWSEAPSGTATICVDILGKGETKALTFTVYLDDGDDADKKERLVRNMKALGATDADLLEDSPWWNKTRPFPVGHPVRFHTKGKVSKAGNPFVVIHWLETEGGGFKPTPKPAASRKGKAAFFGKKPSLAEVAGYEPADPDDEIQF